MSDTHANVSAQVLRTTAALSHVLGSKCNSNFGLAKRYDLTPTGRKSLL